MKKIIADISFHFLAPSFVKLGGILALLTPLLAMRSHGADEMQRNVSGKVLDSQWQFDRGTVQVSPDARHLVLRGGGDGGVFVRLDGKDGKSYDSISPYGIVFSPDSKRLAYIAKTGDQARVVIDGKEGDAYEGILDGTITFSPDGNRVAYVATTHQGMMVVVDGKAQQKFQRIRYREAGVSECTPLVLPESCLVFSTDSKRLAYIAETDGKCMAVVNGETQKSFDEILPFRPVFRSVDGQLSYLARLSENFFKVTDRKEEPIPGIRPTDKDSVVFSPDGRRSAYISIKAAPVVDGQEQEPAEVIDGKIVFSPDSKRVAYIASNQTMRRLFVDGKAVGEPAHVHRVMSPVFSPDSQHVAHLIKEGNEHIVVVDGEKKHRHKFIWSEPVFSPDGKHLAYWTCEKNTDGVLVLDGIELHRYGLTNNYLIHKIAFSPDSKRIATWVALFNRGAFLLVNSTEGDSYTGCLPPFNDPVFDSPTQLHYIAARANNICLIEETLR